MESIRKRAVRIYIRRFKNRYFDGIPLNSWWFILTIPLLIPFLIVTTLLFLCEIIEVKITGKINGEFRDINFDRLAAEELSDGFSHVESNLYHRRCNKKCLR